MANNRMYLRCKGCGATLFLGKRLGGEYWWENYYNKSLEDSVNEFYKKHDICGQDQFDITYEFECGDFADLLTEKVVEGLKACKLVNEYDVDCYEAECPYLNDRCLTGLHEDISKLTRQLQVKST